jgi:hypothetical protein
MEYLSPQYQQENHKRAKNQRLNLSSAPNGKSGMEEKRIQINPVTPN